MKAGVGATLVIAASLLASGVGAQRPHSHAIYMTAVEFKGSTTTDKLEVPQTDPSKMSKGYAYKGPGQADPAMPTRWGSPATSSRRRS